MLLLETPGSVAGAPPSCSYGLAGEQLTDPVRHGLRAAEPAPGGRDVEWPRDGVGAHRLRHISDPKPQGG
ncbi:hypothetical protein AIIKEEIJ_02034 [Rhodococcus sp. YH1]|nr:hypothetical protein AAT18_15135 [Rhodococcus aetherivorans]NCL74589.1 hypothetical protein [Rhodococcus sp. YH1]